MKTVIPILSIPPEAWEPSGSETDSRSRLATTICINGVRMHLEAYAVIEDEDGARFADQAFEREDDAVINVLCGGWPATLTLGGRQYALVATPFQE